MNISKTDIDNARRNLVAPLLSEEERLSAWAKVKGMWKNKKPDPIKELKKMRKEWENRAR